MSGGSITGYRSLVFVQEEIVSELLNCPTLDTRVLKAIQDIENDCESLYEVLRALDYLFSGDIGEESFKVSYNQYKANRGKLNYQND